MLDQPYFNPCYSVVTIEPDQVFLLSERETVCLKDRFLYLVASLIDGHRSSDEIIEAIQWKLLQNKQPSHDRSIFFQEVLDVSIKAQAALFQMEKEGYLVEQDDLLPSNLIAFCHHLNVNSNQAYQRLKSTKVAVTSFASLPTEDFIANLKSLHIQIANESDSDPADLTVVLTDDYLNQDLDEFNQKSLESQIPWILVKPVGTIIWMGPLFDSQQTACWQCLARRLQDNRPVVGFVQRANKQSFAPIFPQGFLYSTMQTALGMAATEVFKWIVQGENNRLKNTLITYDTLTHQSQEHFVVKRPQCLSCGQKSQGLEHPLIFDSWYNAELSDFIRQRKPVPIVLGHRQKTFTSDGGHRSCSPQETLRKYQHHLSPLTGVVRELTKIPGNSLNHTYIAKHHFVTIFDDLDNLRKNLGGRSAGKGRTDIQARASGFCEAIERYSGVYQGDELRKTGSYQQMGERAIHPNSCMNFSQQQYQTRKEWNAQCQSWFQKVPEPFDEEREIDWTPVWSLTEQDFKYLPTAYCYYGYPQSHPPDCWADSNGCAAGNTIEEAILQGFMELVERDAVALWWYNCLQKPLVDLDSFDEPYFQSLKQYYQTINRELWVLDITSDLNIPVFAAISRRSDREVEDIVLGYGSHFDPKIAISRSLTEVNQVLPNVLQAKADGNTQYHSSADPLAVDWWKNATLANQPYLVPDDRIDPKVSSHYPEIATEDLLEDVKLCQQIVENNGLEMLVLDQTRSDIGLRVAKVIVPGMRHMWKRLAPGRLYEVSVKMGWMQEPLAEDRLNAFPMWM